MGFFGSLTDKDQRKDLQAGYEETTGFLNSGAAQARGELNSGYGRADNFLARSNGSLTQADNILRGGQSQATGYLDPYIQSGGRANSLYGNALGLNGYQAQKDFGQHYAANDPFRAQNSEFATEDIMRAMNARGMSGSSAAQEIVAQQSLRRGSEDYNNYLNRLSGVRDSGQQASTNAAQLTGQFAGQRAGIAGQRGAVFGARAENAQGRGNALANLTYGNAQQLANQRMGLANGVASSRTAGINNILKLGELAVSGAKAAAGAGGGGV